MRTLKMAVHAGNPGPYVHKVISKLVDRLHGAKTWLVRFALVLSHITCTAPSADRQVGKVQRMHMRLCPIVVLSVEPAHAVKLL